MTGPPAASLAAMYQETLLAHYRAPQHRGDLPDATGTGSQRNPVCGDALTVQVRVADGMVDAVRFNGRGCSIATASASLMTLAVTGLPVTDARALSDAVARMLAGDADVALPTVLDPLRGVAPFPGRHGCARMAWEALREAVG